MIIANKTLLITGAHRGIGQAFVNEALKQQLAVNRVGPSNMIRAGLPRYQPHHVNRQKIVALMS